MRAGNVPIRAPMLIGRDHELQTIDRVIARARSGHGRAVFIVGEAGIGKSRLASTAASRASATGVRVLRGRGSAIGAAIPYRSLTEALLSLLRDGDPIDIGELGPYGPVLARLIPDLGQPSADQDGWSLVILAEAVLRLTALAGRERGCVLNLDDLHDADAETLAVVEYLVDNLDRQPMTLLGTLRPEPGPALELARAAAQRGTGLLLMLERLDRAGVREMAGACLDVHPGEVSEAVVDLLWAGSVGNPFLIEELLAGMVDGAVLTPGPDGWQVAEHPPDKVPAPLVRSLARRIDPLGPAVRDLLSVAATLGRRIPLTLLRRATGLAEPDLLGLLRDDAVAHLIGPDEQSPGWYAFRHPLVIEALLSLLSPTERARLARRAAEAVETTHPGLPGEWCQHAATLRWQAGESEAAGTLFAEAGRRALAQGATDSAVALLDRAHGLLAAADAVTRAGVLESLLYALAEAGQIERALAATTLLDELGDDGLDPRRRAHLHIRLAWAAAVTGRFADGQAQVELARALLGPEAEPPDAAHVDVVAAHLALDLPGPNQLQDAEELARRAATVAESAPLPVVACQAWQLLGALTRPRDPDEATACLERARSIAVRHGLVIWEIHALVRLGNDDALRDGSLDRLEQVRATASRAGAVIARYQAEASLALQAILRGQFDTASALMDQILAATTRLKLVETTQYVLLLRVVQAGHRGQRRQMHRALAEFRRAGGDQAQHAPRVHGLAGAFCALLEENRDRALEESRRALRAEEANPTIFHLAGRYGLDLLLRALNGELDESTYQAVTTMPASRLRWDRLFAAFAWAVLAGRAGRTAEATAAVAEALRLGKPYAMGRHLGLRLVSEAALADGWGSPVEWLRIAENYFHDAEVPAVAGACRALLRRAGVPAGQRRAGIEAVPTSLRSAGVTVREYEVLRLLAGRLSNREIAERLHLSPRTVEKHVASLMAKTGRPDRIALGALAANRTFA